MPEHRLQATPWDLAWYEGSRFLVCGEILEADAATPADISGWSLSCRVKPANSVVVHVPVSFVTDGTDGQWRAEAPAAVIGDRVSSGGWELTEDDVLGDVIHHGAFAVIRERA